MSKVVREDNDNMTAVLTVTVEKQDYESKLESELSKYRKQAHMKGFRKNKTPMSVVRKMYGRAVLAEVVNNRLQEELFNFLTKEDIDILGQPLPAEDQAAIDFDLKELEDFVFRFDVGLAPQFDVQGVGQEETFEKYAVEIPDDRIDEEINALRRRQGERELAQEDIRENDLLKIRAVELQDGEVKEGGVESEFNLLVDRIDNEQVKQEILAKKAGDTLRADLFDLENDTDEKYVRRYFLKLEEDDDREVGREYELTIEEVSRIVPAELDQDFFDAAFGEDEVHSEEEARERMRRDILRHYDDQADSLLFRDFQQHLMARNELSLPDEFLRRWLKASNENLSEEAIDREYDSFAENLRWTLIRGKLVRQYEIKVEREEILEKFKERIRSYFGGQGGDDLVDSMAVRMMENEKQVEQVYEDIVADRLHDALAERVTITPKPIGLEEFQEVIRQAQAEAQAGRNPTAGEEEE